VVGNRLDGAMNDSLTDISASLNSIISRDNLFYVLKSIVDSLTSGSPAAEPRHKGGVPVCGQPTERLLSHRVHAA
jgi:hypothetical protein